MSDAAAQGGAVSGRRLAWLTGFVAAAVIAFEVGLMRLLLVASWSHFAFLVISIALLGFGASGPLLVALRRRLTSRAPAALFWLSIAFAVAAPVSQAIVQGIPVEARFVPALLWRYVALWSTYWAVLAVPFLIGGAVLGLTLMIAGERIGSIYGANLIGSGAGGAGVTLLMFILPPAWLVFAPAIAALIGATAMAPRRISLRATIVVFIMIAIASWLAIDPPSIRVDPYKYRAYLGRLLEQEQAEAIDRRHGPRGEVEVFRSPLLHDIPFLSGAMAPPPLSAIVIDGHWAGSVLEIAEDDDAEIVENTLMAAPYQLAPRSPRVLLLGDSGTVNPWLALRHGAETVDIVQRIPAVFDIMRGPLRDAGGEILDRPSIHPMSRDPRHMIDHSHGVYDLIQLVSLESWTAGSGGVGGLAEDHLITLEGVGACLDRLSDDGILFVCRGIQTPPRDNLKLFSLFGEALRRRGADDPSTHVAIVRDFMAVCTMIRPRPWRESEIADLTVVIVERGLTPVWFNGVDPDELNQPDTLPAPSDGDGDWHHYAAKRLFSADPQVADSFIDAWAFDIRPPTDNRPFFQDFFKAGSLDEMRQAYGELWLTRVEIGFLFVAAAAVIIAVVGAVLVILPLPLLREIRGYGRIRRGGRTTTLIYFAAIGLAYMLTEMTALSRLSHLIGDPVVAASVTIAGFLAWSGVGSLIAPQLQRRRPRSLMWIIGAAVVGLGLASTLAPDPVIRLGGSADSLAMRCAVAAIAVGPLAFAMGFMFPLGLSRIDRGAPALTPWAWGVNGFASVLAPPLAMIMAMTWGYHVVGISAATLYAVAAALFAFLPDRSEAH